MSLLLLLVAGTAALLAMDAACYSWLLANEARRTPPARYLAAVAIRGQAWQKWLRGSR